MPIIKNMAWGEFFKIFVSVFLAELGDKTQIATMMFASDKNLSPWVVFLGSATALVFCSALGVGAGTLLARFINPEILQKLAGIGFIIIGILTLWKS